MCSVSNAGSRAQDVPSSGLLLGLTAGAIGLFHVYENAYVYVYASVSGCTIMQM